MLRPDPAVPIERPPTGEEVLDEIRARLTLVALRAQEDGEASASSTRMALHQDALGSLGDRAVAERSLAVVVLGDLRSTISIALCQSSTSASAM
jgi:hypothetical protein